MNKPQEWDNTEAFTGDFKTVTPGGHICKILGVKEETTKTGKQQLVIMFDIIEGDCKGYYADQYAKKSESNPDAAWQGTYRQLTEGKSLSYFKGMITAIEKSNPDYTWNWDESTLRGKMFGGVFGQEEYRNNNGDIKLSTKCRFIRSVEQVRKGVEVPEIKKLQRTDMSSFGHDINSFGNDRFPDEDIPF